MTSPIRPVDIGQLIGGLGSPGADALTLEPGMAVFTGDGDDRLRQRPRPSEISGGFSLAAAWMAGGSGDDIYRLRGEDWVVVAESGGGDDIIRLPSRSSWNPSRDHDNRSMDIVWLNGRDLIIQEGEAGLILIDPLGKIDPNNSIETIRFGKDEMPLHSFLQELKQSGRSSEEEQPTEVRFERSRYSSPEVTTKITPLFGLADLSLFEQPQLTEMLTYNSNLAGVWA